jgi:hypothetical protein
LVQSKKCLTNFFHTSESNGNETSKEFDIEEVNSKAGSTRDLLIEVCPDNIDTVNLDPEPIIFWLNICQIYVRVFNILNFFISDIFSLHK